jgi:hypothetical protein
MRSRLCLLATVGTVVATTPAPSQVPPAAGGTQYAVKKCDEPNVPIGWLPKVAGQVTYLLGKDGRPDTATVAVVTLSGMSVAGFRSVAKRQLSVCRFDIGTAGLTAAVRVVEEIGGDSATVTALGATPATEPGTTLAIESFDISKDSFPLPIDDRRIDERPRRLSCPYPQRPRGSISSAGAARADAQAQAPLRLAMTTYDELSAGTLVAQVRVGVDGRPGTQVRVISVSNPSAAQNLAELIGGCRFVPARYHGVLVAAFVETTIKVWAVSVP